MGSEIQFKGYEPGQGQLFAAFLSEALDPSDPALFVDDLVEGLDLSAFEGRYEVPLDGSLGARQSDRVR